MRGIFISYRREDAAGYAGRLYDRLAAHFGDERVFMDVEGIEPGADFVEAIERAVGSCEALIVIIGDDWLATDSTGKRRLDDPADFVRVETATALARGIRVVPVLVEGAVMPRADQLPADLAPLTRRQAVELSHKQWEASTGELIRTLEKILDKDKAGRAKESDTEPKPHVVPPASEPPPSGAQRFDPRYWAIGGAVLAVAAAVLLFVTQPWRDDTPSAPATAVAREDTPSAPATAVPRISPEPAQSIASAPAAAPEKSKLPAESPPSAAPAPEKPKVPAESPPVTAAAPEKPKPSTPSSPPAVASAPERPAPLSEAPPPIQRVAVPDLIGKSRREAVAELEKAGLKVRVVEAKQDPGAPKPVGSVLSQVPKGGEQLPSGGRVTLHVAAAPAPATAASAPAAAAPPPATAATAPTPVSPAPDAATTAPAIASASPATASAGPSATPAPSAAPGAGIPRVGDTWQYRARSIWKNVDERTFVHQVTAASGREVRETMSEGASGDNAAESRSFGPDPRFVEWRGRGFHFVEFNPFLHAFGALQPDTVWKSLAIPIDNPYYTNWYSNGRVVGWETVSVPAGSFRALRVELNSSRQAKAGATIPEPQRIRYVIWYAPDAKRTVKHVRTVWSSSGAKLDEDTYELVKYRVQ